MSDATMTDLPRGQVSDQPVLTEVVPFLAGDLRRQIGVLAQSQSLNGGITQVTLDARGLLHFVRVHGVELVPLDELGLYLPEYGHPDAMVAILTWQIFAVGCHNRLSIFEWHNDGRGWKRTDFRFAQDKLRKLTWNSSSNPNLYVEYGDCSACKVCKQRPFLFGRWRSPRWVITENK
jgi:hypothetical protein